MNNFERISIVGNGLSAWMMCAFMAKQLKHTDTKITLHTGVVAEAAEDIQSPLPLINNFFKAIDVSPDALTGVAKFHPKLGTAYLFDDQHPFFHMWGQYGAPVGPIEFHQVVMRYKLLKQSVDLNKLSIGSASVLAGRFQKPAQNTQSIFSTYESSWSLGTEAFLALLKSISMTCGVEISEEKISKVVFEGGCYVLGESTIPHHTDYLINTVPGLIEGDQRAKSWFMSLPFELKSKVKKKNTLSALVNKVKVLDETSWLCEITHRDLSILNVYQFVDQDSGAIYVHEKPRTPRCLNFGPAMANMYSPVFTPIDLNLVALELLLRYFPSPSDGYSVVNEFNKTLVSSFENLRDITQLCLGELFSKNNPENSKIALSEQAAYKANLFKHRGRYPLLENEFFKAEWQIWLLLGLGFKVDNVEPMVSRVDNEVIKQHIFRVEESIMKNLSLIPLVD
jgi:hypothetical protein